MSLSLPVQAETDFREPAARKVQKISKITIVGQKKIEEDAIRNKLISKVGEDYSVKTVREDVESIFKMGYFLNIEVDQTTEGQGVVLTYRVMEKPSIVEIKFLGNDEVEDDDIAEVTGIATYEILDHAKIQEAIEKIEKLYEDKGFFLAKVDSLIKPVDQGKGVELTFSIQENDMVKVKKVHFIGVNKMSQSKLKSAMQTQEGGFFSFVSDSGAFKQDVFDRDVQLIHYLYYNDGFVQAKVDRPQVYVSPDKKSITISIRVSEGERFSIGSVDFIGDLLFDQSELAAAVENKEGVRFSYERLQKDLRALTAKYGDLGYAYTNVIPRTQIREKDRIVDITYEIDKGNKVFIGKINVIGNSKTRDKVLRRELKIREGELYNETRKRESEANIRRLGFFEEVQFNTSTPKGRTDLMDITIKVKERNTGTITVGAGYSSFSGFVLNGQVNQTNLFGRGQSLGVSIDFSDKNQLFNLNFTEPYFMDTEWSVGGDLYSRRRELPEYDDNRKGAAIRVGHPLAPYLRGIIGYKIDDTDLELDPKTGDPDLFDVDTANGVASAVTASLIYDKRNDRFAPTDGVFGSLGVEYAGIGGDLNYTKGSVNFRYYQKAFWDVVWRNNISYGFVNSNDGGDVPFNELFLLGGATTLRGFRWYTIGQRKYSNKAYSQAVAAGHPDPDTAAMRPFGGKQQFYYNMEFQFPLIDEAGIKGVVFYDIGDAQDSLDVTEFRSDVGFGFRWFSPIGPLRFEWGFPLDRKPE
ncbi:MAG: outer membrane protein assembly factor BamA, partial [Bdellovibrionales bacterium]|nr:outer membrane protein assembly factor BamA [Bdellovibrionales bacterium]